MRPKTRSVTELHQDWLSLVETAGPFLALPVIKDIWPAGVERLGDADDRVVTFKQAFLSWQRALDAFTDADKTTEARERYAKAARAWIDTVLDELAGWETLRIGPEDMPADVEIRSPGDQVSVRPSAALKGRDGEIAALVLVSEPTSSPRDTGLDGWAANEIDRMAMLLRKAQVEVGVVTDGQWWALVWAKEGKPTGSGMVNALTWAEEPLLRDAFLTLIDQRRFRAKDAEQRLPRLFARSELEAEQITEALGTQVRRSVELLVQAFSEARIAASRNSDPDPLADDPDEVYQAAVTIMMRVVFLLFAEEREMLPTEQLYWDSYAIRDLLSDLKQQATDGEEPLDESFDVWHRLLAVSSALYSGVNYDEMRMPAYGGSLLDPARFPWLSAVDERGLRLKVSDRVMLHVLESVQTAVVGGERRRVSFRDVDVEQIGYIYEGLLGYSCKVFDDRITLGLVGKEGEEPEIDAATLQRLYESTSDAKTFTAALLALIKTEQPAAKPLSAAKLTKLYDAPVEEADMRRLLMPVAGEDEELLGFLVDWSNYIRRDLRGIPLVIPAGGLVVVETTSRKNAGAHYTPRSLAEEVVQHALEPLVYEPGPLQTNDRDSWVLKSSSAILDLKVADIAAGSGAFLVAAARFLAARVLEAWGEEERLEPEMIARPEVGKNQAIREVISRCLYGADINPMAIEMCKLSLWLVSMDKSKPFSFVDDKVFCGNALLGLTSIDQLRYLHIYPQSTQMQGQLLVDVDGKLAEASRLRQQLATPVLEHDPMRSIRGKISLLEQLEVATSHLRLIADAVVATALQLGGKPGSLLDSSYKVLSWELSEAHERAASEQGMAKIVKRTREGLTPTVDTDYQQWTPIHWVLEAPDVFFEGHGFDAIVGNPPFLGGKKISGAYGSNFREYLVRALADDRKGECDLVGYFFLRAGLLCPKGVLGLIASESLSEGEARRVCLGPMLGSGHSILRSHKRLAWPTEASVHVSLIWATSAEVPVGVLRVCDGILVAAIDASLEPVSQIDGSPFALKENEGISFMGSILSGKGFILSQAERQELLRLEPQSAEICRPLVIGSDVNQKVTPGASGYVIDFATRTLEQASLYPLALDRVRRLVKPLRDKVKKKQYRERWWLFAERGRGLNEGLATVDDVMVIVLTSDTIAPVRLRSDAVFTNSLGVFLLPDLASFALLSSSIHQLWAMRWGSSLDAATRYTTSDVFETFPRVDDTVLLAESGALLERRRQEVMLHRNLGLTPLYGLVHNRNVQGDADIDDMRRIQVDVDTATMDAYGWGDISLDHGFHSYRQIERWTVSPAARVLILDRLLELNHERARA